jgi:hypothetical protein
LGKVLMEVLLRVFLKAMYKVAVEVLRLSEGMAVVQVVLVRLTQSQEVAFFMAAAAAVEAASALVLGA